MRRTSALALFLAVALAVMAVMSIERKPHEFRQEECPSCHLADGSGGIVGRRLTAPVAMLCRRCHEDIFSERYLHPVDVRPVRAEVPADMPLSARGKLTCSTCHDPHGPFLTPFGTASHLLRRHDRGRFFCEVCHQGMSGAKTHTALGEAHFTSKYVETDPSQGIDPMSMNCISCHDGSYAASVTIRAGVWSHGRDYLPYDRGSHPIGVDYEAARLRAGRRTDLKPIAALDRKIRFFDGKMGCGSCHNPYSPIEKNLVMSNERSKLCFSCHELDR